MQMYHSDEQQEAEVEDIRYVEVEGEEDPLSQKMEDIDDDIGVAFVIKNSDGMFECEECFQTYKSLKRFLAHVKKHGHLTDESYQKLEEYVKKVESNENIYDEVRSEEDPTKIIYRCRGCETEFDSRKKILLHYPIHRNVNEARKKNRSVVDANDPALHCSLCNKSLNNAYELEMHMNAHAENGAKPTVDDKRIHPKIVKTKGADGKSSYFCGYCEKEFKRPHEKVKHERIHTGEKFVHKCFQKYS